MFPCEEGRKVILTQIITIYFEIPLQSLRAESVRNPEMGTDNCVEFQGRFQKQDDIIEMVHEG